MLTLPNKKVGKQCSRGMTLDVTLWPPQARAHMSAVTCAHTQTCVHIQAFVHAHTSA